MKKLLIITLVTILSFLCLGCGRQSSEPARIDVVGKTLESACRELSTEGWTIQVVDETPSSNYVPGAYENGDTKYGKCKVTHVEFERSKSAGRGYATAPTCKVYFESGDQGFLEDMYAYDALAYYDMCYDFWERFVEEGRSEELLGLVERTRDELVSYEDDMVPFSGKEVHKQLVREFDSLIDVLNGDTSPYEYDIDLIRQEHAKVKEKMSEHVSSMSGKYGSGGTGVTKLISRPDGAVDWSDARDHVGETTTVYGLVASTEYASSSNNQPTFIDIGAAYPDESRVTAVIWGEDREAFPQPPEEMYKGKTVCVTGEVYLYNGVCNIKVASPSQVEIL